MCSRLSFFSLPVVAFFALSTPVTHAAQVQNRITSAVIGASSVPLEHAVPVRALRSADLGPAPADRVLTGLSVRFSMTAAQQADLTQLLSDQLNPSSPSYHKWLTPEQFGARFGLSSSDIAKVSTWLTSQGFAITGTARSSTFISFTGTVALAQKAFGTSIHSLLFNGEQHISNLTNPAVPSAIANVVMNVTGLNDFKAKPRSRFSKVALDPKYTYTSAGVTSHFIAPGDFYTIYDVNPLLTASTPINGTGITIAIMGQTDLLLSEVAAFRSTAGLSVNAPTTKLYGADPGTVPGDIDEASLDVEWSGTVAPSAKILYVYSTDVFTGSLANAVDKNLAPIMSISYGICEAQVDSNYNINSLNQILQQANAEGITVVGAAGDGGATDCDIAGLASEGLAVDFPGSSPFITSAGGTMFSGDVSGPSAYWNASNGTNAGSAKSYIPEQPWNETTPSGGLTAGGAGGGGSSVYFSKPAWQTGTGVPADGARDVPDFSLNSGAVHDGTIVCSEGDCTNGFLDGNGNIDVFGGTSVAAPSFAGMVALVEQKLGGGPLGNIGPNLYGLASVANVYNDITSGNNSVYCIQGTPNCTNGGPIGYNAGVGYDLATGLGSINTANFVNNWTLGVPTGGGSTIGAALSNTTLSTAPATLCGLNPNSSLTFTATVTNASTSSGSPTGTVQFYMDRTAMGSPVPLSGSTASYTLTNNSATGLASGQHNITAVYLGDATFAGSQGALLANSSNTGTVSPIDVVSATKADFSITPCTASSNVLSGNAASAVVLTIAPFNGFTGSVSLSASSDTGDLLGYAFSVQPVVVSSATGVTTSFVLTATVTNQAAVAHHLKSPTSPRPMSRAPWYAAGSGATLACLVLLVVPRRRRWGTLLAVLLSVAAFGVIGCSTNTSTTGGGGGGGGGGPITSPASPGPYNITITATSGTLVHSVVLTYNVAQ